MGGIFLIGSYPHSQYTPFKNLIFGGWWGAYYYSASPISNKKTEKIRNRPSLLVLTCWKRDDKLIFFGNIIDGCSLTSIVDIHWHVFFLPVDQKISNEGWFCWLKMITKLYVILWMPRKIVTENTKKSLIRNLWEKWWYMKIWYKT